jgi:hypothetical protein
LSAGRPAKKNFPAKLDIAKHVEARDAWIVSMETSQTVGALNMRFQSGLFAIALVVAATAALAADPVGHYQVSGNNPSGGSQYTGEVTVSKTGDTFKVVWIIDGTTYVGTGLGNEDFIAVSYKSGDQTGLALFGPDNADWKGIWTYAGGKTIGAEKWTRK